MKKLIKRLNKIQTDLKAPKNQYNNFGKYNYRSCEDIIEAVKPLLGDDLVLLLNDKVVNIGNKNYIKATAVLIDGENSLKANGWAREAETQKGMNDAQLTGSSSSYARKYALNGLFAIDDTKDADTLKPKTTLQTGEPIKPTERNPVVEAVSQFNNYQKPIAGDKCQKCGAEMVLNPKTGKVFCKNKCWLKK